MTSILEDLFYGRIATWERKRDYSKEERALHNKILVEEDYFLSILSVEDAERFKKYQRMVMDFNNYSEVEMYSQGFVLGGNIMLEVMQKREEVSN